MITPTAPQSQEGKGWYFFLTCGRSARKLFHGLAFHAVVDGHESTFTFYLGIPWIFALRIKAPLPLTPFTAWISGGVGERAEYGIWHDYYETKFQWRYVLDRSDIGCEKRVLRQRTVEHRGVRQIQYLTDRIADLGNQWAADKGHARWSLLLTTWHVKSEHFWIPDLYDHRFILKVEDSDGKTEEAALRAAISPRLTSRDVFISLTRKLQH